jgi:hypothetical protein
MSGAGAGTAALVIIGIIIVVISILSGQPLPLAILGVAAIAFGALLEAWVRRGRT